LHEAPDEALRCGRKVTGRIDTDRTRLNESGMTTTAPVPRIADRNEWQRLRQDLLEREKAHMRSGDAVAAARRRLPMMAMEPVELVGANGKVSLHDVFEGRKMLLAYFFMWNRGAPHHRQCEGCTHVIAQVSTAVRAYLAERDVTYAVFSRGPYQELAAYRDFMGWTMQWYSTERAGDALETRNGGDLRSFLNHDGKVFLTYETSGRGVECGLISLRLLDLTPYGRQETWEDSPTGYPQTQAGGWWRRQGRPVAQWTVTDEPVAEK
jgi:predicted dithiol-disulfide oxidoreductase (DUF899 family)